MAVTLSKKSIVSVKGVCCVKKRCLDCSADQRTSAAYEPTVSRLLDRTWKAYGSYGGDIVDL